jgi:hypothetical protein
VQRQVNDVQFGPLSRADFQFLLQVLRQLIESSDKAVALQKYLEPTVASENSVQLTRNRRIRT